MTPAIEIKGLGKTYRNKKFRQIEALIDLNLQISTGEVFGFLGPNGAGKSTTIKMLLGLLTPSFGSAKIGGIEVSNHRARRNVGFLPENPAYYDFLSSREYLAYVGHAFGMSKTQIRLKTHEVLERVELLDAAKRPVRSYSKGMVQRLGLAQTMLHDPDIYVLDEPMSGLDPLGRVMVKNLIHDLKQSGKTVFFSSHITEDVEQVCDRVGILVKGELRTVKSIEEIMESGVVGYCLHLHQPPAEIIEQFDLQAAGGGWIVRKENLSATIVALSSEGVEVDLIEPCRENLEDFFLKIVGQS